MMKTNKDLIGLIISNLITVIMSIWTICVVKTYSILVIFQISTIIILSILIYSQYISYSAFKRLLGINKIYKNRGEKLNYEYEYMKEATVRMECIGIMHKSFWNDWHKFEEVMLELNKRNVHIGFYLCSPDSPNLKYKADEENAQLSDWKSLIEVTISNFKEIKKRYPSLKLDVLTYDTYPVWHVIILDDRDMLFSWYPEYETGFQSPMIESTRNKKNAFSAPVLQWYKVLKASATKIV
jgi:hypothetical protein